MFHRIVPTSLTLSLLLLMPCAWAQDSERDLPTEITADALRHDDQKQLSIFTGNVVLKRGSLVITGSRLELQEKDNGEQRGVATGAPATFKRVREQASNELIQGEGKRITYDSKSNTLQLRQQAQLRRLRDGVLSDEVRGETIDYFDDTGVFTADNKTPQGQASGRVRVIIGPKAKAP